MRIWLLLSLLVAGCNQTTLKDPGGGPVTDRGLKAFETSVYAYARAHCAGCHGVQQSPRFAHDDLAAAYRLAKLYVDFSDAESSKLVVRSRNGHCGSPCATDGKAMAEAVRRWWEEGEKAEEPPPPPPLVTKALAVPPQLPEGNEFAVLEWSLDTLGFPGSRFRLEAQRFGPTALRLRKPRLVAGPRSLRIRDVRIRVNGNPATTGEAYAPIDKVVAAGSAPVLSIHPLIALSHGKGDTLAVQMGELGAAESPRCREPVWFAVLVKPLLEQRCWRCHGDKTSPAHARFPLTGSLAELCREARQRLEWPHGDESPLIAYPLLQANGHPVRALDDARVIREWAAAEANNTPARIFP